MAIVVGFDFGTHQTKICIANNDDPRNIVYDYLSFINRTTGESQYILPSFLQVNEDHTISYGWAGDATPLRTVNKWLTPIENPRALEMPEPPLLPQKPVSEDAIKPISRSEAIKYLAMINQKRVKTGKKLISFSNESVNQVIKDKTNLLNAERQRKLDEWRRVCQERTNAYKKICHEIEWLNKEATIKYESYLSESQKIYEQVYTNFKYQTFVGANTDNILTANQVSLFYITYVIFLLEERCGKDFSIQFGVPASPKTYEQQRRLATRLILKAFDLVENVFANDMERFLSTKYEELVSLSNLPDFDVEKKEEFGIIILPEASACLHSIVAAGKLSEGKLHLMMDIGGGTTDISFFAVNDHEPKIYWFRSVPYGLNFIRQDFKNNENYKKTIQDTVDDLIKYLYSDFAQTGKPISYMEEGLEGNLIVYNGGGSSEPGLCMSYSHFKTIRKIADIMPLRIEESEIADMAHVLSNAYGLAYQVDDETQFVKLYPIDSLLKDYKEQVLAEERSKMRRNGYEHGLSDL